ncbi:hypothetical protein [Enterocloster citroniae]
MLNCMVTCRSMDKKPCDNTLEDPTNSHLVNNALPNMFGDDMTKETLSELVGMNQALKEASSFLNNATVEAICSQSSTSAAFGADSLTSATSIVKGISKSAFKADPFGLGDSLRPFCQVTGIESSG